MSDFFHDHSVLFALVCALIAVAYGIALTVWLLGRPEGSERMREIARAVQEGAAAYLRRQYTTIAVVSIVPFLLLGLYPKGGLKPALNVAFRAGTVTGLLVVGLGLLGVAGYYALLTHGFDNSQRSAIDDLGGLAFGGSLISVFARLGGGIFTKAADV